MSRKIISIIALCALLSINVYAHTATIEMAGENKYKAARIPPEIYKLANPGLSDLLVTDEKGENVPYFLNWGYRASFTSESRHPMALISSYIKDDEFYFDYAVSELPGHDMIATSIRFATNHGNFAKNVTLYGSHDNIHWEKVRDDSLYNVDGKSKLEIVFSGQEKFTHYRLKLANNLERIAFDSVELLNSAETRQSIFFIEELRPRFTTEEEDKTTYIHIEGLKNLRLAEAIIETDSMFLRDARALPFGLSKEIFNLTFNGASYTDTTIPLGGLAPGDEPLTLTIYNADDRPINIKGILIKYYADDLVFEGSGSGTYTIHFGADDTKTAPVYDIERYKNEILQGAIDRLEIKGITLEVPEEPSPARDFSLGFNAIVIIIALLLGLLIMLKLRNRES